MKTTKQAVIVKDGKVDSVRPHNFEKGFRNTENSRLKALYNSMYADPELVATIRDIREMDRRDGRVKKIHGRTSRALTKSGLKLDNKKNNKRLENHWKQFVKRLDLDNRQKLESDARGLIMEGTIPLQWVINKRSEVVKAIRMPVDTLRPNVAINGQYKDVQNAWEQWDQLTGKIVATFPVWQLTPGRLTPDNYDDMGSLGRPYLDSTREIWKKLIMTEEDLVIRRRERAPMRTSHVLEGANPEELEQYRDEVEADQQSVTTNYYANKKGGVTTVQGDANLDQIADVAYLLDTFFGGAPAPKAVFGLDLKDISRDILEDLKRDFYDELDAMQEILAWVYEQGFRLQLLLQGLNPDAFDFCVEYKERLTETLNQRTDRALKQQAMGASQHTVFETAGLDPNQESERKEDEADSLNPYPSPNQIIPKQRVNVTEDNAKKGESQTTVSNG